MTNKIASFFLCLLLLFGASCNESTTECCVDLEGDLTLVGEWQVYEQGYSPGADYIVEEVPASPEKTMIFGPDNAFSSNFQGLEIFDYYLILDDNYSDGQVLALFEDRPDPGDRDLESVQHSYSISFDDGNLILHFRFCIEGCHIGLKRK